MLIENLGENEEIYIYICIKYIFPPFFIYIQRKGQVNIYINIYSPNGEKVKGQVKQILPSSDILLGDNPVESGS